MLGVPAVITGRRKRSRGRGRNKEVEQRGLKRGWGASLVVQWIRIRLPMQGTQVRSLVREDPTCRGATSLCTQLLKPTHPRAHAPRQEKPPQREAQALLQRVAPTPCSLHLDSPHAATKTQHGQKEIIR